MTAPALDLRDIHMRFGQTTVLQGASLAVRAGERVALIGPNGAGKSTLFNLASGRAVPSRGEIRLHGRRIDGLSPHRIHRLGLARSFQASSLFPRLSALDNLRCAVMRSAGVGYAFWRRLSRLRDVDDKAQSMLSRIGLEARGDEPAQRLTYAEQRVLELGLTVISGASTILLDEPTAGMNREQARHIVALIRELTDGKTLLMVEHDMPVVFDLADRIAVLVRGEVIAFDTPDAVRTDARVREAYLGGLAMVG